MFLRYRHSGLLSKQISYERLLQCKIPHSICKRLGIEYIVFLSLLPTKEKACHLGGSELLQLCYSIIMRSMRGDTEDANNPQDILYFQIKKAKRICMENKQF